jgi:hypothetical protein
MSKARQTYKPSDITRAIKATEKAGKTVAGVERYPDKFVLIIGKPEEMPTEANENETSADLRKLL